MSCSVISVISSCPYDWLLFEICWSVCLWSWILSWVFHLLFVCYFSCSYYRIFSVFLDDIYYTIDSQIEKSRKYQDPQCFSPWRFSFSCIANSLKNYYLLCNAMLVDVPKMDVLSHHSWKTSANSLYLPICNYYGIENFLQQNNC